MNQGPRALPRRTVLFFAAGAVAHTSCLGPTEIIVELSTDTSCDTVIAHGLAVAVGAPGDDTNLPSAATHDCTSGGSLGSLVVVPSGAGAGVGIRVTLGVDASIEDCNAANGFAGCIVARRSLEFDPHTPLTLPIALQGICLDKSCDPGSTCYDGLCVDAGVSCTDGTCTLPDGAPTDAAACTPVTTTIAGADAQTPHIAAFEGGYIVTWISAGNLYTVKLAPTGVTATTPLNIDVLPDAYAPRAVGSNGTTFVTFAGNATGVNIYGGSFAHAMTAGSSGSPPIAGVLAEDGGTYTTLFAWVSATGDIATVTSSAVVSLNMDAGSFVGTSFSLARAGGTLYPAWVDAGTCLAARCAPSCAPIVNQSLCDWIRLAPSGDNSTFGVVTHSGSSSFTVGSTPPRKLPQLPDIEAAMPVATSAGIFAVHRDAGGLSVMTSTGVITAVTTPTFYTGPGAGFDAVADDPSGSPTWAAVYWAGTSLGSTGSIVFTHQCGP